MFLAITVNYTRLSVERSPLRLIDDAHSYIIVNTDGSIRVAIRKRHTYPSTFCRPIGNGIFELGYDQEPESLHIYVNDQGMIKIVRDTYATLPVFYGRSEGIFVVSNIYDEVVGRLTHRTLSTPDFLMALMPRSLPIKSTLIREVSQLVEREVLISSAEKQHIELPPDRPWQESSTALSVSPHDFLPMFTEHLHRFIDTRFSSQTIAFQVSGGLDSATLPLFMARTYPGAHLMRGILPPGRAGQLQLPKLRALEAATGYRLELDPLRLRDDFYLAHVASLADEIPIYYRELFNAVVLDRDADELQRRGVSVLATGVGGDDLFENITNLQTRFGFGEDERQARRESNFMPYLTDLFRDQYVASVPDRIAHALPHHALSTMRSAAVVNNRYIERDIWPVTPFIDPELYAFSQGLPAHFRANKNILRAFHQAHSFPSDIYNSEKTEDFSETLHVGMLDSPPTKALAQRLVDSSISVRKGYVDPSLLRATFEEPTSRTDVALALQFWLMAERSLHAYDDLAI